MPELGKATYYVIANTEQFDSAMVRIEEEAIASGDVVKGSASQASAAMGNLGKAATESATVFVAAEAEIAAAAARTSVVTTTAAGVQVAATQSATSSDIQSNIQAAASAEQLSQRVKVASKGVVGAETAMGESAIKSGGMVKKGAEHAMGALVVLGSVAYMGYKTMKDNAVAAAQLTNALDNMGGSAHTTKSEMLELADSLSKHSTYTKADIITAEAQIIRLKNVADKAKFLQLALDAAAASGKGLTAASMSLSRAMMNPGAGMTSLARLKIYVSTAEKEEQKAFAATHTRAEAWERLQTLAIARVKGMAQKAADAQPWKMLMKSVHEISATMLHFMLPAFQAIAKLAVQHKTLFAGLVVVLTLLASAIVALKLVDMANNMAETVKGMKKWRIAVQLQTLAQRELNIAMILNPVGAIIVAVTVLVGVIAFLLTKYHKWGEAWKVLKAVALGTMVAIVEIVKGAVYTMGMIWTGWIQLALKALSYLPWIGKEAKAALDGMQGFLNKFKPDFTQVGDAVSSGMKDMGTKAGKEGGKAMGDAFVDEGAAAANKKAKELAATALAATLAAAKTAHEAHLKQLDQMKSRASQKVTDMVTAMTKRITDARSTFSTAWGTLATDAMAIFDQKVDNYLSSLDAKLAKYTKQMSHTQSGDQLSAFQEMVANRSRMESLNTARSDFQSAQASGDPSQIQSAARALRSAQEAIYEAQLQSQANAEQKAQDLQVAGYAATIHRAQKNYKSQMSLYKQHLQSWLEAEKTWLMSHPTQIKVAVAHVARVFGVSVAHASKLLGTGFAKQWMEDISVATKAAMKINAAQHATLAKFGRQLTDGIIKGFGNFGQELYGTIGAQIDRALAKLRAKYGIKSPSELTAATVGVPLGQGVVTGFSSAMIAGIPTVLSAAQKLAAAAYVPVSASGWFTGGSPPLGSTNINTIDQGALDPYGHTSAQAAMTAITQGWTSAMMAAAQMDPHWAQYVKDLTSYNFASALTELQLIDQGLRSGSLGANGGGTTGPRFIDSAGTFIPSTKDASYAMAPAKKPGVTINQYITKLDPNQFQLIQDAKFAADGVFG